MKRSRVSEGKGPDSRAVADIVWATYDDGGCRALPIQQTYRSVIRFDGVKMRNSEAWDVEVGLTEMPSYERANRVAMSFMANGAPSHLLVAGAEFTLVEGPRIVARGTVVGAPAEAPRRTVKA